MLRRLYPVVVVFIVLVLGSPVLHAQTTFKSAVEMNNYLLVPNDSMYQKGQAMGRAITEAIRTKDFTGFAASKKAVGDYAATTIQKLKKQKDQFGSKELREAIIGFLEYEINFLATGMPLLDKLNSKSTDQEIREAINELVLAGKEEEKQLNGIRRVHQRFAEKNGITVSTE